MDSNKRKEAEDLGISEEEYERVLKEKTFVTTNRPVPPKQKSKILTTHELPSDMPEQRFWDPKTKRAEVEKSKEKK